MTIITRSNLAPFGPNFLPYPFLFTYSFNLLYIYQNQLFVCYQTGHQEFKNNYDMRVSLLNIS